ncbi:hypothetical protein QFZ99_006064 [Paraburkholderia atlantica]|uniref:hypothetical protein n=1 Tax=Paraburkholderia atlantica TaxID=2654982 RepID=UPI003D24446F
MSKQKTEVEVEATAFHTIECAACGTAFEAVSPKAKYCRDECKAEGKREANRRFYRVHGSAKADPKNQARTLVEQYLWAKTGETLANGWTGGAGAGFARRTEAAAAKIEPMLSADAKRLLRDAEQIAIMLNVKALCAGKKLADLTTLEQSEEALREALAVAVDGLAAALAQHDE